jgi:DGQHR domain-containing protein
MAEFQCLSLEVRQPSATFYVASVKAGDLEKICRPLRRPAELGLFSREMSAPVALKEEQLAGLVRSLNSPKFKSRTSDVLSDDREQPYQRFLDERRAVEISRYLQQPSALLPNSIILAVNVDFDESEVISKQKDGFVRIHLPQSESSAVILDGQHRVAALRYLETPQREDFELVVTFLVGIPFYQQAEIFAIINGKQKPVNKSIIFDLFGYTPSGSASEEELYEGLMAVARFCSHVTRILNVVEESPWASKIKMRGPGDIGIISQAAVVEYLTALVEPKTFSARLKILPLLYAFFKKSDPAGCASLLIVYLRAIQTALPEEFNNPKTLFWKNNGVAVILRILHDHLMLKGSVDSLMGDFKEIVERWRKAPRADIMEPPKSGGGGVQNQLYQKFQASMFDATEITAFGMLREDLKQQLVGTGALIR